jgi:hypothetical protein
MSVKAATKTQLIAKKKFLIAAEQSDEIRTDFAAQELRTATEELRVAITPLKPLKTGLGGEIIPSARHTVPGLESALKTPDLLNVEATIQRADLADKAGVFELALDASESVSAKNAVEQMLVHQMTAAHRHSMRLLSESEKDKDPQWATKKVALAARLMDAYARGALTLQRLQSGPSQSIVVQQVSVACRQERTVFE